MAVASKRNELSAVPDLLHGRDQRHTITTMDAFYTQRALTLQFHRQVGGYLMMVKANQPQLDTDIAWFFELSAIAADQESWDRVETVSKGNGRFEARTLECISSDYTYLDWPGAIQLIRRTCERHRYRTGKTTRTVVTYGITNLPLAESSAALLETLWCGHRTIESRSHDVRDVTLGEDANHMQTGHAPQALGALCNGLLTLW